MNAPDDRGGEAIAGGPVDIYLDALAERLRGRGADIRRMLAESEDHLREAAEASVAAGADPMDAERLAVEAFGSPRIVARRFAASSGAGATEMMRHLAASLVFLGGIGLAAIGASGLLAWGMGATFGKSFIAGDPPGVTYTAARCADFLEYFPHAASCNEAALDHHYEEVLFYRELAGGLGVIVLAGVGIRRWRGRRGAAGPLRPRALPDAFADVVGAALFGAAGVGLLGLGLMEVAARNSNGAGQLVTGGAVALVVGAFYSVRVVRLRLT